MKKTTKPSQATLSQQLKKIELALAESHKLLRHYATLLNNSDGGSRVIPEVLSEWVERVNQTYVLISPSKKKGTAGRGDFMGAPDETPVHESCIDLKALQGTGIMIDASGKKLWVCNDGASVLRVTTPMIAITDYRPQGQQTRDATVFGQDLE